MAVEVLRLDVDSRGGVRGAKQLENALDKTGNSAQRLEREVRASEGSFDKLRRASFGAKGALLGAAGALAAVGAALGVRQLIEYADTWTLVTGRLRLVTDSTAELREATGELHTVAQRTRQAFGPTADLFTRMAQNQDTLGATTRELLTVTEAINQSMVVSGATSQGSAAALYQLNQAFTTGVLRGEEFNSVNENGSRLMDALATSLGVGRGELRKLAEEGRLTSDLVFGAILEQAAAIESEFGLLGKTVGQGVTVAQNSFGRLVGTISTTLGASESLADGIIWVAGRIDDLTAFVEANSEALIRWGRGFVAIAKTLAAPIRIAFNLGQTIGEIINSTLAGIAYLVSEAVNLALKALNKLPGVDIALINTTGLVEEYNRANAAIVDNGRDILDTLGDVGRAWANIAAPIEAAADAAAKAKDKLAPPGSGGLNLPTATAQLAANPFALLTVRTPGNNTAPAVERAITDIDRAWDEAMRGIQRTFADGFQSIFSDGLSGFKGMANGVLGIFRGLASQIVSAIAVDKLGIDDLLKTIQEKGVGALTGRQKALAVGAAGFGIGYSSGSPLGGIAGGALSGAAIAGPIGALGGAVAGLAGGLLGAAAKTRQAERILTQSLNDVAQNLRDIEDAARGVVDPTASVRAAINTQFDNLRAGFAAVGLNISDQNFGSVGDVDSFLRHLRDVEEFFKKAGAGKTIGRFIEQVELLRDTFRDSLAGLEQTYRGSLQDRLDAATGNDTAVLLRRQQRERDEAINAGYGRATLALLDQVHEQERLAAATRTTSDAIRDVTSALNAPSGLRLSLLRWRATQPSLDTALPPATVPITGGNPFRHEVARSMTVTNNIYQQPGEDSEELAERVVEALEQKARLGGPSVINRLRNAR